MKTFRVTIGARNAPRLSFEAMSESSIDCAMQHAGLVETGERMEVMSLDELAERDREAKALAMQIKFASVEDRIAHSGGNERS